MTFQPVIPFSGYSGWRFLQRTLDNQKTAYVQSNEVKRASDYFRENIGKVRTAEDLVNNRRLLEVSLKAFGLEADINNKYFIRKVLEDGVLKDDALSNKLSDKRYSAMALAFGFGDLGSRTALARFPDEILNKYNDRSFEAAVGEQNDSMRLAMNVAPGISDIIEKTTSADARWFAIMGNPPLRKVFEGAFGLPKSFGTLNLDQQLGIFKSRAEQILGSNDVGTFTEPDKQEKLIRLYLIRSEASTAGLSSGSVALSLLQASQG